MKGLSGAVTALILVIASVIVALIVVGFAFGLFGTMSSQNAITNAGSAYITYNPSTNEVTIYVTLTNPGPEMPTISGVSVNGVPITVTSLTVEYANTVGTYTTAGSNPNAITISTGLNYLTITGTAATTITVQSGATVTIQVSLSNGQVVTVPAMLNIA